MKSAYELAMERLSKSSPTVKLTDAQRRDIAEVDSLYASRIAEREIFLKAEIGKAVEQGDHDAIQQLERQLTSERKRLQAEMDEKKDKIRDSGRK